LRTTLQQYGQILRYGGTPAWSEAIFPLAEYLQSAGPAEVLILDWGLGQQLRVLSRDRLPIREAPQPPGDNPYYRQAIEEALTKPAALFVGYASPDAPIHALARQVFHETVRANGKKAVVARTIEDLHGRAVYSVWAVR
jgi:hypothetical protein